jgi:sulfide:quinone oxidoreductase
MEQGVRRRTVRPMSPSASPSPPEVLIVGGGVAALEALIALRALAGHRVRITLAAPSDDFIQRPLTVAEPFEAGFAHRHPLREIAADFDARVVPAAVTAVATAARRVLCRSGDSLSYDTLVLAPGARAVPPFEGAVTFGRPGAAAAVRTLLDRLADGAADRVAFVAPTLVGWSLPLYELALMTAATVRERRPDGGVELFLVTPEQAPLEVFGADFGAAVARLLDDAGVHFVGGEHGEAGPGAVRLPASGRSLSVDAVVSLPLLRGPRLEGIPGDPHFGFIPTDAHGRVLGLDDVYAAGDATDFPVKQGGLATQQADAVAAHVARRHGAPVEAAPFRPVLRGMLFTGAAAGRGLWRPTSKVAGRYLAPYLAARIQTPRATRRAAAGRWRSTSPRRRCGCRSEEIRGSGVTPAAARARARPPAARGAGAGARRRSARRRDPTSPR